MKTTTSKKPTIAELNAQIDEKLIAYVEGDCEMEKPLLESLYKPSIQRHVFGFNSRCGGFYEVDITSLDLSATSLE